MGNKIIGLGLLLGLGLIPQLAEGQTPTATCVQRARPGQTAACDPVTQAAPFPTAPGQVVSVPLDIAMVTTGGTAVTAIAAGHRTAGGWIQNPSGAQVSLCINEIGTASGTASSGNTVCIGPGLSYNISPGAGAVSVISSDSAHTFAGLGYTR